MVFPREDGVAPWGRRESAAQCRELHGGGSTVRREGASVGGGLGPDLQPPEQQGRLTPDVSALPTLPWQRACLEASDGRNMAAEVVPKKEG